MDKLDEIFLMQSALDRDIEARRGLHFEYETWMQKDILATMDELTELLNELNYKWWKNEKPLNRQAIHEELTDVLHFFVSMCLRSGMDAEQLYACYVKKNQENFDRQNGLSQKKGYEAYGEGKEETK